MKADGACGHHVLAAFLNQRRVPLAARFTLEGANSVDPFVLQKQELQLQEPEWIPTFSQYAKVIYARVVLAYLILIICAIVIHLLCRRRAANIMACSLRRASLISRSKNLSSPVTASFTKIYGKAWYEFFTIILLVNKH